MATQISGSGVFVYSRQQNSKQLHIKLALFQYPAAFQEDHMGLRWLNSQKKIPLYTRLGTVTIEIHLSVYHRESSNNKRWKQLLFELP